ncbi:MAG: MFS transporter, partial [Chloroflexota bacterium]
PVPTSAVISYWFKKKRGTAVGLTSAGIGAGGVVMAPVAGYLLESVGWRLTYLSLGVIVCLAIIPLALLIVRTRPEEVGLHPDGATDEAVAAASVANGGVQLEGITLHRAMCTLAFWFICVSYLLGNFSSMGGLQAQVPNLEDIGFPTATAAVALGAIGFGSGVGKILFGWLCDRMHPKHASAIGLSLQCAALLILLQVGPGSSLSLVWVYALLMGFGAGSWLPTMSMLVSHRFGLAHYGSVFGVVNMAQSIGTATGPLVAGLVFDVTGTYQWAFVLFASLYAVAIPAVLFVRRPRVPAGSPAWVGAEPTRRPVP